MNHLIIVIFWFLGVAAFVDGRLLIFSFLVAIEALSYLITTVMTIKLAKKSDPGLPTRQTTLPIQSPPPPQLVYIINNTYIVMMAERNGHQFQREAGNNASFPSMKKHEKLNVLG